MLEIISSIKYFAASCQGGSFFQFPKWYKYLDGTEAGTKCTPVLTSLNDFWLIGLAIIEILLRVAILIAIAYVMIGGLKFITARGQSGGPDKLNDARNTVVDGLVGLAIAIAATAVVTFVAGRFIQ